MKPEDWVVLGQYVRDRADDLALRDWTFTIAHDPPSHAPALAETRPVYGRRLAAIRFCVEFRELTDDEQRHVVIHELLHCHLADLQHQTGSESRLEKALGQSGSLALAGIAQSIEYAVDAITDGIAEHHPLIAWTTEDPTREESANAPYEGPIDDGGQA